MKLPLVDAHKLVKLLTKKGYRFVRQNGSHMQFKNDKGILVTVPFHGSRLIGRGLLLKILRDMEITRQEFISLLNEL